MKAKERISGLIWLIFLEGFALGLICVEAHYSGAVVLLFLVFLVPLMAVTCYLLSKETNRFAIEERSEG